NQNTSGTAGGLSGTPSIAVSSVNSTTIPTSKTLVVTTDKLSALSATTSAELAGVISDETGTGSLVFSNSPALVTPALGTPASGNLGNCTYFQRNRIDTDMTIPDGYNAVMFGDFEVSPDATITCLGNSNFIARG
ncbi:MAG: hypothetical protein ACR2K1_15840, partial [Saprospiraceae bacterium]